MNVNSCTFTGRLLDDPKLTPAVADGAQARLAFRLAVNRDKTKKNPDPGMDVIPVVCWGVQATNGAEYMFKGMEVSVECSFRTNFIKNADGTFNNYHNFSPRRISYGMRSLKKQQELDEQSKAGETDIDAIGARLAKEAAEAKKAPAPQPTMLEVAANLQKTQGMSEEDAVAAAKVWAAKQETSEAPKEASVGDDGAPPVGDDDIPF